MAPLEPNFRVQYKEVEGSKIHVDIYLPAPKADASKCPVILGIHGGAFMLGHSRMVNSDQIQDCVSRGWIVLSLDHRLCPQVDMLEGPMSDCRDALAWVYEGGLDSVLKGSEQAKGIEVDQKRVVVFGTSSGGHLALSLGFPSNKYKPLAIYDMYGAKHFADPFWTKPLENMLKNLPPADPAFINTIWDIKPVPTQGGLSLEGQGPAPGGPPAHGLRGGPHAGTHGSGGGGPPPPPPPPPPPKDPRPPFALSHIANGTLMRTIWPSQDWSVVDPILNIDENTPPTIIVHGEDDDMVPMYLSKAYYEALQAKGVKCDFVPVPGEKHTFAGKMVVGSQTWDLQRRGFDFLEEVMASVKE